ncbi:MAG: VWA domain-containing protein, partial [Selenomonadaceae bacterium]|nr:VWA domain-containing protein [Selenomonadaceae bacterium]
ITKMIDLSVHQMALMSFSDKPKILSELTNDASKLTQELPQIEAYGGTAMIEALHAAEKVVENSTRQKIALIVTDGYPDRRQQTLGCARKVRDNGLKIIAIGVGVDFDKNYLDEMVGEKNAFTIKNMSELTKTFEYVINALTRGDL